MNECRKCGVLIPNKYKWNQALRCSECRSEIDKELLQYTEKLDNENKKLIQWAWRLFEQIEQLKEEVEFLKNKLKVLEDN